jgi:protein-S-isoprenylcysteine O-methyltransferase Ste14
MALREEFERSGNRLFRYRSFLPLLLLAVIVPALAQGRYPRGIAAADRLWEGLCLLVSLAGLGIRVAAIGRAPTGTSGRTTDKPAADLLTTTGLYSVVRHPLYVGNAFMILGVALFPRVWWCPVITLLAFALYYERIMFAEEEFLRGRFGEAWLAWADRTPAVLPRFRAWRASERPFALKKVVRHEHSALFGLVATFAILKTLGGFLIGAGLEFDPLWAWLFAVTAVVYVLIRVLKSTTRLLTDGGR